MPSKSIKLDAVGNNLLFSSPVPLLTATLAYSLPWGSKIALLTDLYASVQPLTIPCLQNNQNVLCKTKKIVSCPCGKPPVAYYTTEILYVQALLYLILCH